jgi:hypothetical protein
MVAGGTKQQFHDSLANVWTAGMKRVGKNTSTVRRKYVCGSFRRIAWKNNVSPRAKLAR